MECEEEDKKRKEGSLVEVPGDGDLTIGLGSDGGEGTIRQVEGVVGSTGWTDISNGDGHGFTIVEVGNGDAPAAVLGLLAHITVPSDVNGTNEVRVAVVLTASTSVAILVVESGKSTGDGVARVAATRVIAAARVVGTSRVVSASRVVVVGAARAVGGIATRVVGATRIVGATRVVGAGARVIIIGRLGSGSIVRRSRSCRGGGYGESVGTASSAGESRWLAFCRQVGGCLACRQGVAAGVVKVGAHLAGA